MKEGSWDLAGTFTEENKSPSVVQLGLDSAEYLIAVNSGRP